MKPLHLLASLSFACLAGCGQVADAWMTGRTSAEADDRIMLVRQNPESFGYRRLSYHIRLFPDVATFVVQKGLPDFIAEMNNRDQHYIILYYLNQRHAYACRTRSVRTHEVEFAGPYPITPKEMRIFENFRRQAEAAHSTS